MGKIILAHLSDLHFGARILNDRFTGVPHRIGHDKVLALALTTALEDVPFHCKTADPINVIVSGDLTSEGNESEFAVAHTLLLASTRLTLVSPPDLLGYTIPEGQFASVPGNHDQFGAGFMAAYNPSLSGVHFEVTPWHRRIIDSSSGITLDLFGLDTNSGFIPAPPSWNVAAWGSISNQQLSDLERLLNTLAPVSGPTIRALVMHHSLSYFGGAVGAFVWMNGILPPSRQRIRRICADYDIAAILSGHTHNILCKQLRARSSKNALHSFWELRSKSTLVGPRGNNGFLVHEISDQSGGRVSWDTYSYSWKSPSFQRDPQKAATFII
jgi:3',5'-cyclic AMP phosphodiesterase CpdA